MISAVDVRTGDIRVLHRENDWTNHLQCSPTDPAQILFCHEGPWHFTNRTWTLRTDGGAPRARRGRDGQPREERPHRPLQKQGAVAGQQLLEGGGNHGGGEARRQNTVEAMTMPNSWGQPRGRERVSGITRGLAIPCL